MPNCIYYLCINLVVIISIIVVDKVDKMAVSVLVVTVLLLSVSEVISECPPSSGKTLDLYDNNCIGFYRYLPDA